MESPGDYVVDWLRRFPGNGTDAVPAGWRCLATHPPVSLMATIFITGAYGISLLLFVFLMYVFLYFMYSTTTATTIDVPSLKRIPDGTYPLTLDEPMDRVYDNELSPPPGTRSSEVGSLSTIITPT